MVASAVYITDLKGKVLISRNYRGNVSMSAADKFAQRIRSQEDMDIKPVFTIGSVTYSYIKFNNVYLLATSRRNVNVTLILLYLYRMCDVFKAYFGEITEESIKDNFVIIYELLDETIDYGKYGFVLLFSSFLFSFSLLLFSFPFLQFIKKTTHNYWRGRLLVFLLGSFLFWSLSPSHPLILSFSLILSPSSPSSHFPVGYPQTTEHRVLKEFIMQQGHKMAEQVRPPISLTNAVSWRSEGIIHKKNEIFLDIVEKLNLLVASNGTVLRSEIIGAVKMKSFLSGMPELKLGACFPKFFVLTTMKYIL